MSNKIELSSNKLIFSAFPLNLAILIAAFNVVFIFAVFYSDNDFKLIDIAIFQSVILIAMCIQQYKTTTINRDQNEVVIYSRGILNRTTKQLLLSNVKAVEMSYGRGSGFASGGAIVLITESERIAIATSDISTNSVTANKEAQKKIEAFIFSEK